MVKIYAALLFFFAIPFTGVAQKADTTLKKDTAKQLQEVMVRGYLNVQPVLSVPASVSVLSPAQLKLQPDNSLVSALNAVPGVRFEERSPGSYRLSIRSTTLRSPFGVRDVKLYYDDIPLTDAGGNTYLNAIDVNSVKGIEVLKGPDGSLFGANSEGVVLINPVNRYIDSGYFSAGINTGSYGLFHENAAIQNNKGNNQLNINQAYQTYNGYRQNSAMNRNYIQAVDQWNYAVHNQLKIMGFYSDLNYRTPGGLTLAQYQIAPTLARPATKALPGAIDQKIGIYQKMLFGGIVNEWHLSDRIKNVSSIFGTYVDFKNPFITNYEQRYETTYGFRSYFELDGKPAQIINWKINLGIEWQQTNSNINNYSNKGGARDTAQTLDKINTNQHFIFGRYVADVNGKLHIEAALSLNFYDYDFRNVYPNDEADFTNRHFTPQLMPRVALSYQVINNFAWRVSASRGYSTPTTAEIRPTDNIINTGLQAESGWNYETGFRLRNSDESMYLDASVFYYRLQNAIVRRLNPDETEYYVNAGGTKQPGFELYFTDWIIRQNNNDFIRGLQINESFSYSKFTFTNYLDAANSYSGNQLPGVPEIVNVLSVQVKFPQRFYLFVQHNYTDRIPLDDGNTVFAGHYNLLGAKAGWQCNISRKIQLDLYAGADNLLNQKYSLGDDVNAIGNRFFNPAPPRNYYIGMNLVL